VSASQIVVRLNENERATLDRTMAKVRATSPRATVSDVVRRLLAMLDRDEIRLA
jgi:hypothetical protein